MRDLLAAGDGVEVALQPFGEGRDARQACTAGGGDPLRQVPSGEFGEHGGECADLGWRGLRYLTRGNRRSGRFANAHGTAVTVAQSWNALHRLARLNTLEMSYGRFAEDEARLVAVIRKVLESQIGDPVDVTGP
jgi:hypothetical protein